MTVLLSHVVEPVSLATPIGSDGDTELADVVADATAPTPFDLVADRLLGAEIDKLLSSPRRAGAARSSVSATGWTGANPEPSRRWARSST